MNIKILPAYDFPEEIKLLFSEYTGILIEGDASFKKYLEIQNYDDELEHLEKKYGLPDGRLYIAYYNNEVAGCISLKKIDEKNCEMKRLYVRLEFRGKQIGEKLIEKIIKDAKEIIEELTLKSLVSSIGHRAVFRGNTGTLEPEDPNDKEVEWILGIEKNKDNTLKDLRHEYLHQSAHYKPYKFKGKLNTYQYPMEPAKNRIRPEYPKKENN